jgi:hypothetical protein
MKNADTTTQLWVHFMQKNCNAVIIDTIIVGHAIYETILVLLVLYSTEISSFFLAKVGMYVII